MPRLLPSLLRLAAHESPFLAPVLRECRDLPSARNELRWLREHAVRKSQDINGRSSGGPSTTTNTATETSPPPPRCRRRCRRSRSRAVTAGRRSLLSQHVERRCRGEPLQYIIGSQPFGELEILCEPGVLIPRCETETYTERVGCLVGDFLDEFERKKNKKEEGQRKEGWDARLRPHKLEKKKSLRVLDLCTGTGCIPLGIYEMLSRWGRPGGERQKDRESKVGLEVLGVDISATAVGLARRNLLHNIELGHLPRQAADDVRFMRADVLQPSSLLCDGPAAAAPYILDVLKIAGKDRRLEIDILTANPPYISPMHFSPSSGHTARSVRKFEPGLALVPASTIKAPPFGWSSDITPTAGDEFYYHILPLADRLHAGLTVLEVGDTAQAHRVLELARRAVMSRAEEQSAESVLEMWFDDGRTQAWAGQDTRLKVNDGKSTTTTDEVGSVALLGQQDSEPSDVNARAIVIWKREWAEWRRQQLATEESHNLTQQQQQRKLANLSSTGEYKDKLTLTAAHLRRSPHFRVRTASSGLGSRAPYSSEKPSFCEVGMMLLQPIDNRGPPRA